MSDARPSRPSPAVVERVTALAGAWPRGWARAHGGYTTAGRWLVRFDDGRSAFAKVGTSAETAAWLRAEWAVYSRVAAPFLPAVLGWDGGAGGDEPILLLEDLSAAHWPPPWSPSRIAHTLETLAHVAATPPPPGLPALEALRPGLDGWPRVAADPGPFLGLRLCSPAWLEATLPVLMRAAASAPLAGESLLHLDVRSDNLCFIGERVVLVDWNWACRGNARMDVAAWLPSLRIEGGPEPWAVLPGEPGLAALLGGYWAAEAGLPPPTPGSPLREAQARVLRVALGWAARELALPPPGR